MNRQAFLEVYFKDSRQVAIGRPGSEKRSPSNAAVLKASREAGDSSFERDSIRKGRSDSQFALREEES
jgi:hypothetical protein